MNALALRRALEASIVFQVLWPQLTIFPLRPIVGGACTCARGAECKNLGKHPDGSLRPDDARWPDGLRWSTLRPGEKIASPHDACGYGVAAGARSDLFVVDLDGVDAIESFFVAHEVPPTFRVQRGPDHLHVYFRHPGYPVKSSVGEIGKGIDVRGEGGFVVCPGSPHKSGDFYTVADDSPIAPAPASLLALECLRRQAKPRKEYGAVEPVQIGTGEYARRRMSAAVEYLRRCPLSIEGRQGRNTFFSVCLALVRWQRLPIDVAARLVDTIYNPRLLAVGTTTWGQDETINRLESARDTASQVPPGDIMSEACWLDIVAGMRAVAS